MPQIRQTRHRVLRRRVRSGLALLAVLALGSCASGQHDEGEYQGARRYTVQFQTRCDECAIQWALGAQGNHRNIVQEDLWSHKARVYLSRARSTTATLTVRPMFGAGPVDWARIYVNGELVASASRDEPRGMSTGVPGPLSVSTPVPPPGSDRIGDR